MRVVPNHRRGAAICRRQGESTGGGKAERGLCDEGARQAASILGRPARSSRRLGNEGLDADHIENGDEPHEQLRHRLDFLAHPRKRGALDMIPTRPHGVERIGHGFCRGACCLNRNHNKIILKRNSNILNTTIELRSIYIANLKPVSPIILQEKSSLALNADLILPDGRRRVVRHEHDPVRTIQTGIGLVEVQKPKARDRTAPAVGERIRFASAILPKWAQRTKSLDALLSARRAISRRSSRPCSARTRRTSRRR